MIQENDNTCLRFQYYLSKNKKPIIIISIVTLLIVTGIVCFVLLRDDPDDSTNGSPHLTIPNEERIFSKYGMSGLWLLQSDSKYMTKNYNQNIKLSPLFNPIEQRWVLDEIEPGWYTIKNDYHDLYLSRSENPYVRHIELRELYDNNTLQLWKLEQKYDPIYGFRLNSRNTYVNYDGDNNIVLGDKFHQWDLIRSDDEFTDYNASHNPKENKKPKGWAVWYKGNIWKIRHIHINKVLFSKPDNTVGLFDDVDLRVTVWNITKGPTKPDFKIELFKTGMFLTESYDGQITLQPLIKDNDTNQLWMLMNSNTKRIHGIKNIRSGRYIYINETNGWTLTTDDLNIGWNSWELVEVQNITF